MPVPLLTGSNTIELALAASELDQRALVALRFGSRAAEALKWYHLNPGDVPLPEDPEFGSTADQVGGDIFRAPLLVQSEWHGANGYPVWRYEFSRAIPPQTAVKHSGELAYVFGNLWPTGSQAGEFTEVDRALSDKMQAFWVNFAKTGNPNGPGLPAWPTYKADSRQYLHFGAGGEIAMEANIRAAITNLFRENLQAEP